MKIISVRNATRGSLIGDRIELADTAATRRKGLLSRNRLAPGEGLWITPCPAVHSFFMRFALDLVYVDRRRRVRKIVQNFVPWRMSACFGAHSVLELPAGTLTRIPAAVGDQLEIELLR